MTDPVVVGEPDHKSFNPDLDRGVGAVVDVYLQTGDVGVGVLDVSGLHREELLLGLGRFTTVAFISCNNLETIQQRLVFPRIF